MPVPIVIGTIGSDPESVTKKGDNKIYLWAYFKGSGEKKELIISHCSLIIRFWISEARIGYTNWTLENTIAHYLRLMYHVLLPYATSKGKKDAGDLKFPF